MAAITFDIIPAIDIIDGKCVRLSQGDFTRKTIYHDDPLVAAKQFEDAGISRLHLVDLDGAKNGRVTNIHVLEKITGNTSLQVDFGGGVKTTQDVDAILAAGAYMVAVGSIAVKQEEIFSQWLQTYGADAFFLGADVKQKKIAISGWLQQTEIDIFSFLEKYTGKGISKVFCTDISKDGMLGGASIELYKELLQHFPSLQLVASGGVGSMEDVKALKLAGCAGVIVGKAIYENRITLQEISVFNQHND